jgi:hypothetical protein
MRKDGLTKLGLYFKPTGEEIKVLPERYGKINSCMTGEGAVFISIKFG